LKAGAVGAIGALEAGMAHRRCITRNRSFGVDMRSIEKARRVAKTACTKNHEQTENRFQGEPAPIHIAFREVYPTASRSVREFEDALAAIQNGERAWMIPIENSIAGVATSIIYCACNLQIIGEHSCAFSFT